MKPGSKPVASAMLAPLSTYMTPRLALREISLRCRREGVRGEPPWSYLARSTAAVESLLQLVHAADGVSARAVAARAANRPFEADPLKLVQSSGPPVRLCILSSAPTSLGRLRSTPTMSAFGTSLAAWSRVSPTSASQISTVCMSCPVALMSSCIARPTWVGLGLGLRLGFGSRLGLGLWLGLGPGSGLRLGLGCRAARRGRGRAQHRRHVHCAADAARHHREGRGTDAPRNLPRDLEVLHQL